MHERVRVAKVREVNPNIFEQISMLGHETNLSCIRSKLKIIVPEYEIPPELVDSNVINSFDNKKSLS